MNINSLQSIWHHVGPQAETGSNCSPPNAPSASRTESRKSKSLNVLLSRPEVIKEDHRAGSSLCGAGADGQMTPFYHFMPELPLSSPDQSFKSVKVSKFNTRAAYMWLTCAQGEHLHVFELQRGVGWVQSLAVVCHVHVCRRFGQTNSQLPDSGAERLVQEANVPPSSSSSFPSHTPTHLH